MKQSIKEHIAANYLSKAEFARIQGVYTESVDKWMRKGFIVVDGTLYSPRRKLCGSNLINLRAG